MPITNVAVVVQEPLPNAVVVRQPKPVIASVNIGTKGEKGEKGAFGDANFKFIQAISSEKWTIVHNLGKYPSVTVQDSALDLVEGNIEYPNSNETILIFSAPFSGTAYLN